MQMASYEVMTKITGGRVVKSNWPGHVGKQSNTMQSVSGYKVYVTTSFL